MLLPLFLAAVLVFEWSTDQSETRLLVEALVCLVLGVACGMLIVKNVVGVDDSDDKIDALKTVKPQKVETESPAANSNAAIESSASAGRSAKNLEEAIAMMGSNGDAPVAAVPVNTTKRKAPIPQVSEPIALSAQADPRVEPIALTALTAQDAEPIALPAPAKPEPVELPAGNFSFDMNPEPAPAPTPVVASAPPTTVASTSPIAQLPQELAPVPVSAADASLTGPQLDGLFDALQAAVPASHSLEKTPPSPGNNDSNTPTFKVEIALTGPERSSGGGPRESYDSLKLEFAVKGQDQSTSSETRAVVKSLEEKVARMEAVAAKLEAAGRPVPEVELEKPGDEDHEPDVDSRPRKMGTRELVRPLPAFQTVAEWLEYAAHLEDRNNFDDAIKCYDKITTLDAGSFVAWFRKATVLRKKGNYEDALYCMNYALRIDTKHGGAMTEKGLCMNLMGRHDQAMTWFEKALGTEPDFVPALIGKARCLAAMGKHKEALPVYDKALRNEPGNAEARKGREESAAKCPK